MLLRHQFGYSLEETGMILAVTSGTATLSGIFIIGFVMDKYQYRGWYCFLANLITALSFLGVLLIQNPSQYFVIIPLFF